MRVIDVKKLKKEFHSNIPVKGSFYKRLKNYFSPTKQTIHAVDEVDFTIDEGERVAFITTQPNSAYKGFFKILRMTLPI